MSMMNRPAVARQVPNRIYAKVPGLSAYEARLLADESLVIARKLMPKLSGEGAASLRPVYGQGYYGLAWDEDYIWYQELGIRAFTMRNLAGKTIPMWIDDPTGKEAEKNPKARKRVTASGKRQVLIFRRAAKHGQRKRVNRGGQMVDVPASYPGAPGRIAIRQAPNPMTRRGARGGQIATHNVGVRWRHPGLTRRSFLMRALTVVAERNGIDHETIFAADRRG